MRRVYMVFLLCVVCTMIFSSWVIGQETTATQQIPGVTPNEKKSAASVQDKWEFEITPYFWMAGLRGDLTVKGVPADIGMSFSDIMSDFNFGGQLHVEARKRKWGIFLDATYMDLGTDVDGARYTTGPGGVLQVEKYLDAGIRMREWLVEFGGAYRFAQVPLEGNKDRMMLFDLIGGGRYWYLYSDIDVGIVLQDNGSVVSRYISGSGSKQWIDPFIGLRTGFQLSKNFMIVLRGDVGGFSVGSKFSWNASGYFMYSPSETVSLLAGYRALYVNYEDGSGSNKFKYDVTMQGPAIGLTFQF